VIEGLFDATLGDFERHVALGDDLLRDVRDLIPDDEAKYSQGTLCVAPSAVFSISFLGGVGVKPVRMSFSRSTPSEVRNMEPTL